MDAPDTKPHPFGYPIPLCEVLWDALRAAFESPNFEHLIHALELLEPLARSDFHKVVDEYRRVSSALLEVSRKCQIIFDPNLLNFGRYFVMKTIVGRILNQILFAGGRQPEKDLANLFEHLAKEFALSVFTLNYDDLGDRAGTWFDGFIKPVDSNSFPTPQAFDREAFIGRAQSDDWVLVHLHGSIRFGYSTAAPFGIVRYTDPSIALNSLEIRVSDKSAHGNIVSGTPIISGLDKAAKLSQNPVPYGYYYQALTEALIRNPRLLIIGYGGADPHINAWLQEFIQVHGSSRRAVWISKIPGEDVFERKPDRALMASLAGGRGAFRENIAYEGAGDFQQHGLLRLIPSGFPLKDPALVDRVVDHLNS